MSFVLLGECRSCSLVFFNDSPHKGGISGLYSCLVISVFVIITKAQIFHVSGRHCSAGHQRTVVVIIVGLLQEPRKEEGGLNGSIMVVVIAGDADGSKVSKISL
jgi:hypothetical protein